MTHDKLRRHEPPHMVQWLSSVLFAVLVVAGLLGMHTLMTAHAEPAPVSASSSAHHGDSMFDGAGVVAESDCGDCAPGGAHDAVMIACVLGLLAVIALMTHATPGMLHMRSVRAHLAALAIPSVIFPRPPSLWDLSISRT